MDESPDAPPSPGPAHPRAGRRPGAFAGMRLLWDAAGMLLGNRSLWAAAAAPVALAVLLLGGVGSTLWLQGGALFDWIHGWLPRLEAGAWYTWLWVGPGRAFFAGLAALLFALVCGLALFLALCVAKLAAAPFLDVLSQRAERIEKGSLVEGASGLGGLVRESGRALAAELQRLVFFLAVSLLLMAVGMLPGLQPVAAAGLTGLTLLFLPLDYSSYTLDRRQVPFRARRRWILDNLPAMASFGAAGFVTLMVPGLNFLMLPILVVAGTLLVLRLPEPPGRGGGGSAVP